ncbi:MAG: NAD-dependent epimerase/dehydratase family protein [Candidatus Brockarchaeota archaeon]|nr:NAD-dependent epimerase/dehydratase family protein [Candidatus Brockarchaeota archaeon]
MGHDRGSVLVTGGGGFVGSHVAEFYALKGYEVIAFDNLSRMRLLRRQGSDPGFNWNYLGKYPSVRRVEGDVRDLKKLESVMEGVEAVVHAAAQTAVTASLLDPVTDFEINALGTLNVLEAARRSKGNASIVGCSTNKVYGSNVNRVGTIEMDKRYAFAGEYSRGIPEDFPIDHCEHTPYGCSKLAADLYIQDYAKTYGLRAASFRMSCVYGERQIGVEDQGWLAWFAGATILGKPITIYGTGKQVRDVLYVGDLVAAFESFLSGKGEPGVYNIGGGADFTLSLLELLEMLEELTGKKPSVRYGGWRQSDQRIYVSDITKAREQLSWEPRVKPSEGVKRLVAWVRSNARIFSTVAG